MSAKPPIPAGPAHAVTPDDVSPAPQAWVAFCGRADLAWLRLLKPGFRHCFVVLNDGRHWITLDPLACFTEVEVQPVPADFDLPGWYRARGLTVVRAVVRRSVRRPVAWAPFTCVEAVKRVLGIREPRVLTPWQLYRHLHRPETARTDRRRRPGADFPSIFRETA
jgi:hypothetical protein